MVRHAFPLVFCPGSARCRGHSATVRGGYQRLSRDLMATGWTARKRRPASAGPFHLTFGSVMASGVRGQPDISAMASLGTNQLCVLVWHYHDDDVPGPAAAVTLAVDGLPTAWRQVGLRQFRIDANHGNSYQAWQKLGQPLPLPPAQRELLQRAGKLVEMPSQSTQNVLDGRVRLLFDLPRQGVALWQIVPMD